MLLKILTILVIITLLAVVWWNVNTVNVAYFDGSTTIQIPSSLFTKGQKDELSFALKFPKDGVRNGIVLFMRGAGVNVNNFQIVYVQDGKLIINTGNDENKSLVKQTDLKANDWLRFGFTIGDEFKDTPIYFGGAPIQQIPVNKLVFDGQSGVIQFPKSGLMACTNYCYLNDVNLSAMFQKQGLRTYC
jgi:hypothetical protein